MYSLSSNAIAMARRSATFSRASPPTTGSLMLKNVIRETGVGSRTSRSPARASSGLSLPPCVASSGDAEVDEVEFAVTQRQEFGRRLGRAGEFDAVGTPGSRLPRIGCAACAARKPASAGPPNAASERRDSARTRGAGRARTLSTTNAPVPDRTLAVRFALGFDGLAREAGEDGDVSRNGKIGSGALSRMRNV